MKKNKGFCRHVHHDVLMEWCYDYKGRVCFIKRNKPAHEIKDRLRWFQFVKGKLPAGLTKAGTALDKAKKAVDKTWDAYTEAKRISTSKNRRKIWKKADKTKDRAIMAYNKALKTHQKAIEELHAKECPDCSWNGKELIFDKGKKKEKKLCVNFSV